MPHFAYFLVVLMPVVCGVLITIASMGLPRRPRPPSELEKTLAKHGFTGFDQ